MKKSLILSIVAAGVLAAGVAGAVLNRDPAPAARTTAPADPVLEFLASDVTVAEPGELRQTLPLTGTLRAVRQASVKAKVGGEVREVLVREGETARAGQVLVRMDASDYQARVEQARGQLAASRGQLDIATKARDNNQALMDKGFISKNAFDNAASQLDIARANVESARAALDVAQKALADTVLKAPIDGLVASRSVQPGEKVSPDNRLLDVVDLTQMELEAAVPASEIGRVSLGQEVQVKVEGLPEPFAGKVARISPATLPGSRSILVYIQVDNPQHALRAGMFAEARLTLASRSGVVTLPLAAIRQEGGAPVVYAIENGRLVQKPVTLGMRGADRVEITGGLAAGDRVVRTNLGVLRTGSQVRVAGIAGEPAVVGASGVTGAPTPGLPR